MAGPNTDQHYLPQAYLKRWGIEGKKKRFLVPTYNRKTGKSRPIITDQICFERGFLDYNDKAGNLISVDQDWQPIETNALRTLKSFCENPSVIAMTDQREELAKMVAFFLLNSAAVRQDLGDALEDFNFKAPWFKVDEDHNALKRRHIELAPELVPDVQATLLQMKWMLMRIGSKQRFWTSDFPFAFGDENQIPISAKLSVKGGESESETTLELYPALLKRPHMTMWFPFNPSIGVLFGDSTYYSEAPDEMQLNYSATMELNRLQVYSGQQFIFALDNDFSAVEKLAKHDAAVLNPGQPRSYVERIEFDPPIVHVEMGPEEINPEYLEWLESEGRHLEAQELRSQYGVENQS